MIPQWAREVHVAPMNSTVVGTVGKMSSPNDQLYGTKHFIWLLNSGAFTHMTGILEFSSNIHDILPRLLVCLMGPIL